MRCVRKEDNQIKKKKKKKKKLKNHNRHTFKATLQISRKGQVRLQTLVQHILTDSSFPKAQLAQLSKISPDIFLFTSARPETQFRYIEVNEKSFKKNPMVPYKVFDYDYISESFHLLPRILGCCNGFICLSGINLLNTLLPCNPIYVFNPITEEYAELSHCDDPNLTELKPGKDRDVCLSGFGIADSSMVFKLVLVMFSDCEDNFGKFENRVQVHTLGSTIWRKKNGVVPDVLRQAPEKVSVFAHGCLHWMTVDQSLPNGEPIIVSFNLGVEEFGFVPTPGSHLFKPAIDRYSFGVLEGNLSATECMSECDVHIWVMKKYNVKESWVKQFSIAHDSLCRQGFNCEIVKVCESGSLLLLCDALHLVSYNITSRKCRFLEVEGVLNGDDHYTVAHPLVGSLIPLNTACGVDCNTDKPVSIKEKLEKPIGGNLEFLVGLCP